MKRERIVRVAPKTTPKAESVEDIVVEEPDADLLNDIDDLLDEIDSVLEDQAVLVGFRQRSGQ
jgi:ubiquitin-like protein Pup